MVCKRPAATPTGPRYITSPFLFFFVLTLEHSLKVRLCLLTLFCLWCCSQASPLTSPLLGLPRFTSTPTNEGNASRTPIHYHPFFVSAALLYLMFHSTLLVLAPFPLKTTVSLCLTYFAFTFSRLVPSFFSSKLIYVFSNAACEQL